VDFRRQKMRKQLAEKIYTQGYPDAKTAPIKGELSKKDTTKAVDAVFHGG
jgi:hypothetical protein